MGIQSSINSALGTLRVLGALNSGKKYIDKKIDKGAESVKEAAKNIEKKIDTWIDKDGTEMFGKKPKYDPDEQAQYDQYRKEQDQIWEDKRLASAYRARVAYDAVSDKLISKQNARDSVSNMKGILRGDINVNDLLQMDQSKIEKEPKMEENNLNGGAN